MGIFEFILGLVTIALVLGLIGVVILVKGLSNASRQNDEVHHSEARTLQQLHQQLKTMEERIENLETLLLEEEKQRKQQQREMETRI